MERFIVSARKYRPQNFSLVVGQEHITKTLKNAILNNQLAHAFLFCGPRGVGKTTCARILGKTINCENRTPEGEACNKCPSCISFDKGTSMNIHELDAASNNSVDDIRTLVDQVRFAPQAGKYKVYIIDEVHMLSSSAFNAFLKTLEEPPPFAIFILATTEKHKILPTILSRCQIFDFKRISNQDTTNHLKHISEEEHIHTEDAALHLIARKSEGCLRDALSLFDKIVSFTNGQVTYANTLEHLNILDEDYFFRILDALQNQQLSEALLLFDEINRKGFEGDIFLNGFAEFLRNMLISKDPKVAGLLEVAEDFKKKYKKAAGAISASWLINSLNTVSEAELNFRQSRNKRLHVELALIKLSYLNQVMEITTEGSLKKKLNEKELSVSFKAITPVRVKENTLPEKPKSDKTSTSIPPEKISGEAKLIIEDSESTRKPGSEKPATTSRKRFGSLEELRTRIAAKSQETNTLELSQEELDKAWIQYIENLEKAGQHTAINSFKEARPMAQENNCIEIIASSEFNKNFIEAERGGLINHLQSYFNNRLITYTVKVEEQNPTELKKFLNNREKFQKLIKEYPEVNKLKEMLKLNLEI
ncbi:MAG: DNA polymerase III subunit gamma/tau [Chitinophagaceae bacterium]|nr:DNA polymerase III subunit gamma/tau [Chitinophagaceae bacterium]